MTIRIIHRHPGAALAGQSGTEARLFDLEEYMAIQPAALERAFFSFFAREAPPPYQNVNGVAVITIDGPLMQRGGFWFDGYQAIRGRFQAALDDTKVSAVVLRINSPGGVCSGCFSATEAMRAAKTAAGKPVLAFADEHAYSAAYAMACIADEIYLPKDGGVGSVGVIGVLEDWTGAADQMGIKIAVITSGAQKADGHPFVPLSQDVIDRYQTRISALAQSFAEVVGVSREMAPEDVLALEAACLYGKDAVRGGLADGVASLDETIAKAMKAGRTTKTGSVGAVRIVRHV